MRRPEVGIFALAMLASACAFPTESPNWDMTWNLPLPSDASPSIGVDDGFLPTGVTLTSGGSAFGVAVSSVPAISKSLGTQCQSSCPTGNFPFPGFTAPTATTTISLTAGTALSSATIASGSAINVAVNNGFSFDPLKPPGSATNGTMVIAVVNGSTTLGQVTLIGGTNTLPAGQVTNVAIPLNTGAVINTASLITIRLDMQSPSSGTTPVNQQPNTQLITATPTPTLNVAQATVVLAAQSIPGDPSDVDLSAIDSAVVNRITNDTQNRGALLLTVSNPFTLGVNAALTFRSPTGTPVANQITPITKTITLAAATSATTPNVSTIEVALTGQELRRMLGHELEAVFGGTTAAGSLTVTPALRLTTASRIRLNFNVKEVE